ncbi:MAG: acetyl-CoA carboxylase biotin carboxyl carrier protein [Cyanobacteria bacterium Co-bin13]|nr:acetyl-CoA carboxylase biotin carboxyl carrier protein [Cyanobacteria bacterium Co-bin13]
MELNISELRELVAALNQTDIAELTLKSAEFELTLRKHSAVAAAVLPEARGAGADGGYPASGFANAPAPAMPSAASTASSPAIPPTAAPESSPPPAKADPNLVEITSPMVGTFYRSPGPDELPFVSVGERIRTGQTVCIIEAMKLMNELEAEIAGEVVEILVENAEPVEFGQPLMLVRQV